MAEQQKDAQEEKVKVGLLITAQEYKALEFLKRIHGEKYDGVASVLRDYSVSDALRAYETALAEAAA